MSGNPLYSFGASDSGILDAALGGLVPKQPDGQLRRDQPATSADGDRVPLSSNPLSRNPLSGEHVLSEEAVGPDGLSVEELNRQLIDVPLPAGLLQRLRLLSDDES